MEFPNANNGNGAAQANKVGFGSVERNDGFNYLDPGIHTVIISDFKYETPATAKPYLAVEFKNEENAVTTQKFYVSEKAKDISLENLVHIFNKVVDDETLNKVSWADNDWAGMVAVVKPLICVPTPIEIKLGGEEYNGTIYAKFGWKPFAQRAGEDKLFFNPDKDIKREETANMQSNLQAPTAGGGLGTPQVPGAAPAPINIPQ